MLLQNSVVSRRQLWLGAGFPENEIPVYKSVILLDAILIPLVVLELEVPSHAPEASTETDGSFKLLLTLSD